MSSEPQTISQSSSISLLAGALVKAQHALKPAIKDSANPFFKSKYADLGSVWDACRDALQVNGLSVDQFPGFTDAGAALLTTILLHESGEWIAGTAGAPLNKADAQSMGSAITYLRRYALAAVVGVVTEDDDGNAASQPKAQAKRPSPRAEELRAAEPPDFSKKPEALTKPEETPPWDKKPASATKTNMLRAAAVKASIKGGDFPEWYEKVTGRVYEGKIYEIDFAPLMEAIVQREDAFRAGAPAKVAETGHKDDAGAGLQPAPSPTT